MSKRAREGEEEVAAEVAVDSDPMDEEIGEYRGLTNLQFQEGPFLVGGYAPDFEADAIVDGKMSTLNFGEYTKGKYTLLFFYPLDWTFVCPSEITGIHDRIAEFNALDVRVVGCSVDSNHSHYAWHNTPRTQGGLGCSAENPLAYPLISDLNKEISTAFGCLWDQPGHTLRAYYIISDQGKIRSLTMQDDPVGRNVDEMLRLITAYKHNDANPGQVCPLGWQKGGATIPESQEHKNEYFGKLK